MCESCQYLATVIYGANLIMSQHSRLIFQVINLHFLFSLKLPKGGTVLYIANNINFKPRKDLEIYDSKNFESTFIENMNSNESYVTIGVIYRHPNMDCSQFTNDKLNVLLKKLSLQRNKKVYIDGDFNFGLLKADSHPETSEFYENLPLTYLPHLLQSLPK